MDRPAEDSGVIARYAILFIAVAASWTGIPVVGASVLAAAGVLASQGELNIWLVILVATAGACSGGYVGFLLGRRTAQLVAGQDGPWREQRVRTMELGRRLYRTWGPVAVFVTPTFVSGALGMPRRSFLLWNALAAVTSTAAAGLGAYGIGAAIVGQLQRPGAVVGLGAALIVLVLVGLTVRHRRSGTRT